MGLEHAISKNIRSLRYQKGLSQRELAEAIDVDEKFISQLENKPRHVSTKTLERLASGLEVPVTELLRVTSQVRGSDELPIRMAAGIDEAIKALKLLRARVRNK